MPIGTQPTRQTLILPLGIDVPRPDEDSTLFVLGEFILTRAYLFVDPCIADFCGGLAVADASVFGFFVGGAVGDDYAGVVVVGGVVFVVGSSAVGGGGVGWCSCAIIVVVVVEGGGACVGCHVGYGAGWWWLL